MAEKHRSSLEKLKDIIQCFFCIGDRELEILELLSKKEMSVQQVAKKLKISRSSAQKYLKSLVGMQLIERKSIIQRRGRKYVYKTRSNKEVKKMLRDLITDWYKQMMKILK